MFGIESILPAVGVIGIAFAQSWFVQRQKKKLLKKLGETKDNLLIVPEGKFKIPQYISSGVGVTIIGFSIYAMSVAGISKEFFQALSLGASAIYFPMKMKKNYNILVGENGFIFRNLIFLWEEIELIEWDRDIKQKLWALRILKKGESSHIKIYVNREYKEIFDNELREKIADKVKYY